ARRLRAREESTASICSFRRARSARQAAANSSAGSLGLRHDLSGRVEEDGNLHPPPLAEGGIGVDVDDVERLARIPDRPLGGGAKLLAEMAAGAREKPEGSTRGAAEQPQ